MSKIRKDVRDLITVNEKLQSALAQGEQLTEDEVILIRMCAGELLEKTGTLPEAGRSEGGAGKSDHQISSWTG